MNDPRPYRVRDEPFGERALLIDVEGHVDFTNVGGLERALDAATAGGMPSVVVDLTRLSFIDSSGLAALIRARRRLLEVGRQLLLVRPHDDPLRLFQMKGVEPLLEICSTRADALSRAGES